MSQRNVLRLIVVERQKEVSRLSRSATHDRLLARAPEGHMRFSVHFPPIPAPLGTTPAGKSSYPPIPCTPRSATCGKTFISPTSLHLGERHVRENVHFPHIAAPEKFHARIWGNCTTTCSDTGEMGGKPRAAHAEKRTFPQHRCTKFPRCKDMGEMYGKGLGQPLHNKAGTFAVGQGKPGFHSSETTPGEVSHSAERHLGPRPPHPSETVPLEKCLTGHETAPLEKRLM